MTRVRHGAFFVTLLIGASASAAVAPQFLEEETVWREKRHARLAREDGWLTLVGLHWLSPGANAFGSDPDLPVPLPPGKAPKRAGSLVLDGGVVRLTPEPSAGLTIDGKPATAQVLADDASGSPDVVQLGDLSFYVIKRGEKIGVRVKDKNNPLLKQFKGIEYFAPDPKYKVEAVFHPYDKERSVDIPNVLGEVEPMTVRGFVTFTLDGKECSLEPVIEDPAAPLLWYIFKDGTSGKETYGAGRFLYSEMPKDGKVTIDFNQAYNPPCAFTPYATCPLPPKKNWLPVRIEAGEKTFGPTH